MRLVCPNCDAEYEVEDAAIPLTGRDVQCSNCGHAWFQTHPDATPVAVAEAEAPEPVVEEEAAGALLDAEPEALASEPEADVPPPLTDETAQAGAVAPEPTIGPRNIDESVLAVLREEAAREAAARRAEAAPALETQTELGLAAAARPPLAKAGAVKPVEAKGAEALVTEVEKPQEPAAEVRPRRELLPAIEEINSTLRASSGREGNEAATFAADPVPTGSGGRRGFLTVVLVAVILLALYVFAPLIGEKVPALGGAMASYVAAVDAARAWLDGRVRALIGLLRGLEGGSQG